MSAEREELARRALDLRREYRWRDQEPTLPRAILGAVWEILVAIARRG